VSCPVQFTRDLSAWPATQEKQNLLLHEILHIALGMDDYDLNSRALCPLRLLAFCPRTQTASATVGVPPASE